jgi:uncharacterized protein YgbK (DUF1537 family)
MTAAPRALRLMADDLTGALDTAAEFVALFGPVHAFWHGGDVEALPANAAFDTGTREAARDDAIATVTAFAPMLAGEGLSYKKLDSLLRGTSVAEIATCFRHGAWTHAVLAPAFPYQGRATRDGRQYSRAESGEWKCVSADLLDAISNEGVAAQKAEPGQPLQPGITLFNAETDADLDEAVQAGLAVSGPVLWCGSGGLAHALARAAGRTAPVMPPLRTPILGLFGSDQPATAAQLAACGPHWLALPDGGPASAARVRALLETEGAAVASIVLPEGLDRATAAERIGTEMARLIAQLPPPGTLIAAGGETLRGLCLSLGASSLEVQGRIVPGLPSSVLRGGRWDGVAVISKSGAFGSHELLRDLLKPAACCGDTQPERLS